MKTFLFCLLWALVGAVGPAGADRGEAERLYAAALAGLDTTSVEESLVAFERVVEADRKYAPAYVEMAKLYLSLDSPMDRQTAERTLRKAIGLEPENLDYRVALGDLMWVQGFWYNAMREYEKVLKQDPDHAMAAYGVGYYYLKEFMKYQNMIAMAGEEGDVLMEWRHFAVKYRAKAVRYFAKTIERDPKFRDAYYQLGLVYMEEERKDPQVVGKAVVRIANWLLNQYPNDKDALLFCGLGYQTMGMQEWAAGFYHRALEQMGPEERALMESVDLVATVEEQARIARADSLVKTVGSQWVDTPARERFWLKQDPLLLTENNERRMEHYRRVAYANLRFSRPRKHIAGWQTDMGRTYIRFGEPRRRTVMRPEVDQKGNLVQAHMETWAYEGFTLAFQNYDGLDAWRFPLSMSHSIRETFEKTEPRFVDPYGGMKYSMPHLVAAFREGDRVRVEAAYAIPKEKVTVSGPEGELDLEDGFFLFDRDWKEVSRAVYRTRRMEDAGADSLRRRFLLARQTFTVSPGEYHLVAEVQDRRARSIGTFRERYVFPSADSLLEMSDLLLASRITARVPFPEGREDLEVVPNPLHTFRASEPVFVYLEAYGLTKDSFGRTRYEIMYQVGRPEDEEIDPALFEAIPLGQGPGTVEVRVRPGEGGEAVEYEVKYVLAERNRVSERVEQLRRQGRETGTAVSARYEGDREDDFTYLQIDLNRIPAGVYALTVRVRDMLAGRVVEREVVFRVIE